MWLFDGLPQRARELKGFCSQRPPRFVRSEGELLKDNRKEIKLQIDLDENTAQGVYSNFAVVNHSDAEFVIDFVYLQPMQPKAKVRSRIITTPKHAKKLMAALSENLKRYEERFGPIPADTADSGQHDTMH